LNLALRYHCQSDHTGSVRTIRNERIQLKKDGMDQRH